MDSVEISTIRCNKPRVLIHRQEQVIKMVTSDLSSKLTKAMAQEDLKVNIDTGEALAAICAPLPSARRAIRRQWQPVGYSGFVAQRPPTVK